MAGVVNVVDYVAADTKIDAVRWYHVKDGVPSLGIKLVDEENMETFWEGAELSRHA